MAQKLVRYVAYAVGTVVMWTGYVMWLVVRWPTTPLWVQDRNHDWFKITTEQKITFGTLCAMGGVMQIGAVASKVVIPYVGWSELSALFWLCIMVYGFLTVLRVLIWAIEADRRS